MVVNNLAHTTREDAMPEKRMTKQQIKDEQLLKVWKTKFWWTFQE